MKLHAAGKVFGISEESVLRVTTKPIENPAERIHHAFVSFDDRAIDQISAYGAIIPFHNGIVDKTKLRVITGIENLSYLSDGDVIAVHPNGFVRTLYRRNSNHNFILMTAQCNSFCLMCSQPPQPVNDNFRLKEHFKLIELIDPETKELGITGGEPTLFKDGFLKLIDSCKSNLPDTALHVLTNGRMFYYRRFAEKLGMIEHPDIMLGIPLYSDIDSDHDYIVQARGAFEETVIGLHNLSRYNVPVEIRIVLHRQSIPRLSRLAEFITRNFPFSAHIALMGLEMFGFVHRNYEKLWIDPFNYQNELKEAVEILVSSGLKVSIYNHQLCLLEKSLWDYAKKSISDWKNIYLETCNECVVQDRCGGLFQSAAKKHSSHISAIKEVYPAPICYPIAMARLLFSIRHLS